MADTTSDQSNKNSVPSLPVENILFNVANSVVRAQKELDTASLNMATQIAEAELDKQFGLQAKWFAIPELDFDLRLAFEVDSRGQLQSQMVDAEYQSKYGFNVKASSLLKTKIRAVPPPQGEGLRLLNKETVIAITGRIKKIVEAYIESDSPYFIVTYYPFSGQGYSGGLWFVSLMDILVSGKRILRAFTAIDDTSSNIIRIWTFHENDSVILKNVQFTFEEGIKIVLTLNTVSETDLKNVLKFSASTIKYILENKPFISIADLGNIPGLGTVALQRLKKYALGELTSSDSQDSGDIP